MSAWWGIFGIVCSGIVGAWLGHGIGYDRGWWERTKQVDRLLDRSVPVSEETREPRENATGDRIH